jgi:hypothetical protein
MAKKDKTEQDSEKQGDERYARRDDDAKKARADEGERTTTKPRDRGDKDNDDTGPRKTK